MTGTYLGEESGLEALVEGSGRPENCNNPNSLIPLSRCSNPIIPPPLFCGTLHPRTFGPEISEQLEVSVKGVRKRSCLTSTWPAPIQGRFFENGIRNTRPPKETWWPFLTSLVSFRHGISCGNNFLIDAGEVLAHNVLNNC